MARPISTMRTIDTRPAWDLMAHAINLCNACDAAEADPASTAGYCTDCHRAATAQRLRRDDRRASLRAARTTEGK